MKFAAVDVGNDSVKAFVDGTSANDRYYIPNVIARAQESRGIVEFENNPEDGLHVQIVSSALSEAKGTYYVGNLATKARNKDEVEEGSLKSESDQCVVLLLTTLALHSAKHSKSSNGKIEDEYWLSTGLPLREAKQGKRTSFKEKLFDTTHEVRFLDTPNFKGTTVTLKITDGLVNIEGRSAAVDLTMDETGKITNEELTNVDILIHDIGGGSTDSAIIEAGGRVDNENSDGNSEGTIRYLDSILSRVYDRHRYQFPSRNDLVKKVLIPGNSDDKGHIYVSGARTSIQDIIDEEFNTFAREEYRLIKKMWDAKPSLRYAFLVGGGSILIKEYMEKLNNADRKFPLRFQSEDSSIWMIARAYWKILKAYAASKQPAADEVATGKSKKAK